MFQGASDEVIERAREEGDDDLLTQGGTALEVCREMSLADGRWRLSVDPRGLYGVLLVRKLLVSCLGLYTAIADQQRGYGLGESSIPL